MIEAQEPISLIEAVLAHQRGLFKDGQTGIVSIDTHIARVIHTSHRRLSVEHRRHGEDILISLFRGTYNHLGRLTCRHETWHMAHAPSVFFVFKHTLLDQFHGLEHALVVFLRSQQLQRLFFRNLDVHTHTIRIAPCLVEQFARGSRDALQVDIAIETVD